MGPPNEDDWKNAEVFVKFLETFYEVTLKFSGSEYVTSNKYFTEIFEIQEELSTMINESDNNNTLLGVMARNMKQKYDKYWGDLLTINGALLLAVVLDPRYKLGYLRHCYSVLHDKETCDAKMCEIEAHLRNCLMSTMSCILVFNQVMKQSLNHNNLCFHEERKERPIWLIIFNNRLVKIVEF